MAFSIRYRVLRAAPLEGAERVAVIRHVVRHNRQRWIDGGFPLRLAREARADHQVAFGRVDWTSEEDVDLPRFLTAVTELRMLLPDAEFVLVDSARRIGWKGGKRNRYLVGEKPSDRTDLIDPDLDGWDDAVSVLLPPSPVGAELRDAIGAAICGMSLPVRGLRDPQVLRELLAALRSLGESGPGDPRLEAVVKVFHHLRGFAPELGAEAERADLPPAVRQAIATPTN